MIISSNINISQYIKIIPVLVSDWEHIPIFFLRAPLIYELNLSYEWHSSGQFVTGVETLLFCSSLPSALFAGAHRLAVHR